ncbi:MAG: hypothetical protein HKN16_06230 [Saprospiraceae bacterium]|nr:hypothetical protein [Saprospiraceae bacterium]
MMKEKCEFNEIFPVAPADLFNAWLSSEGHSQMTGGKAQCSKEIGASFSAWDGYITGKNHTLILNEEIIQTWRTSEFKDDDEDSELVVRFKEIPGGTEMCLIHRNIPTGQTQYEQGWIDNYLNPMKAHFK